MHLSYKKFRSNKVKKILSIIGIVTLCTVGVCAVPSIRNSLQPISNKLFNSSKIIFKSSNHSDESNIGLNLSWQVSNLDIQINAKSAILVDENSGQILFEKSPHEKLAIASVTKIMTMLLICESIDNNQISLDDMVTCSEYANSVKEAQIYLAVNEKMSVRDMLKGIAVVSGNDASIALAEKIALSEDAFVVKMNEKAKELNMNNTNFANCTGLPNDNNYSSAYDVSLMSRELMKHEVIKPFLKIWLDSLRDGKFMLANRNRLIRFYEGATGIKTGSTEKAGFCLSASATREGLSLISVVLGSESSDKRFEDSKKLLDHGFVNYAAIDELNCDEIVGRVKVKKGNIEELEVKIKDTKRPVISKSKRNLVRKEIKLPAYVKAKIKQGDKIGEIIYKIDNTEIYRVDLVAVSDIKKISFGHAISKTFKDWINIGRK